MWTGSGILPDSWILQIFNVSEDDENGTLKSHPATEMILRERGFWTSPPKIVSKTVSAHCTDYPYPPDQYTVLRAISLESSRFFRWCSLKVRIQNLRRQMSSQRNVLLNQNPLGQRIKEVSVDVCSWKALSQRFWMARKNVWRLPELFLLRYVDPGGGLRHRKRFWFIRAANRMEMGL